MPGGVKCTGTLQDCPGARLQFVVPMENTPWPPDWVAVMFMFSPEAHNSMDEVCDVPGRTDAFTP